MRTISIYKFHELSPEAKAKAIEAVREELKEDAHDQFAFRFAIDDCALFEPAHAEMVELLGEDYFEQNRTPDGKYGQFVFKNTRKGIDWDEHWETARIASALEITNDRMFKLWLGIPEEFHSKVSYQFENDAYDSPTSVALTHTYKLDNPFASMLDSLFEMAVEKFNDHVSVINTRIADGMKYYYSDEEMEEKIKEGDWEFDEDGNIF